MRPVISAVLVVLISISTVGRLVALPAGRSLKQCRLDQWTGRDGLPASDITSIAQTPDGYLWLATSSGLVRFDGSNFTTFDRSNTPGLTSDLITSLAVRHDGSLWIGTEWDGFGPFVNGKFTPVWPLTHHWHHVNDMLEVPGGDMIVSVKDISPACTGLFRVSGDHVIPPTAYFGNILDIARSPDGIVAAPEDASPRWLHNDGTVSVTRGAISSLDKLATSIAVGPDGSLWIGTQHNGLIRVRHGVCVDYTEANGLASNHINCLSVDHTGCLWIGSNNGINTWNGHGFDAFGMADGLYASNVTSIFEDREGNLWVASGFGLNRFAATKLVPFALSRNSIAANVYDISPAPRNAVWCATDLGLWSIAGDGEQFRQLPRDLPASYADGAAGAPDGGVYVWFRAQNGAYHVYKLPRLARGASSWTVGQASVVRTSTNGPAANIRAVRCCADSRGVTFFGYNLMTRVEGASVTRFSKIDTDFPFCAARQPAGDYWVGCVNGLVHVVDGKAIRSDDGLPADAHVLGIDNSNPDHLWLATDKGLADFRHGRSTLIGLNSGLPDINLFQIADDRRGRLWIGGLHGMISVAVQDVERYERGRIGRLPYQYYTVSDGICSYFDLFTNVRTGDGRLWFSGDGGLTMIDPSNIERNSFPPPVAIEDGVVDGAPVSTAGVTQIQPGEGRFHVSFAALSFCAPEEVRFRYRLVGFDDRWTETNRRTVDYTNLPPGTYTFIVRACNNDGFWNPVGATISFNLRPHFYQTLWFRALTAVGLLLLIGLMSTWRMRKIVQHSERLEMLIAERTTELRLSNDQLQAAQEELTAQNHELEAARDGLEIRVAERTAELENAYDRTIEGWSFVMDLRDKETEGHSRRVTDVTVRMAEALGIRDDDLDNIRRGALLHDIGKMGVPDSVLLKPGPLTDDEWKVMKLHPVYAYEILSQIDYLKAAVDIPWCHHEKWDGTGYPRGLKADEIPLPARMFSIVDVWDALRSDRPYRKGWPEEKVFDHLRSLAGTHFEPELVDLFFRVMTPGREESLDQPMDKAA